MGKKTLEALNVPAKARVDQIRVNMERARWAFHEISGKLIIVEKPFELAHLVLNDPAKWNREDINEVIETQKTRTVQLPEPVTVILLYWTVSIDDKGIIYFKNDIYQRDSAILQGLNDEFKFRERPFGKQRPKL